MPPAASSLSAASPRRRWRRRCWGACWARSARRQPTEPAVLDAPVLVERGRGCGVSCPVVEQLEGRLTAAGEELVGQVAVLRGQVGVDERLESRAIGGVGVEALALGAQLVGEDVRDEILLGREVAVEGAIGQAGVGHYGGHTGTVDAVLFEASPGRFDDSLPCRLLVVLAVAHTESLFSVT